MFVITFVQPIIAYFLLALGIVSNKYLVSFLPASLFVAIRMLSSAALLYVYQKKKRPHSKFMPESLFDAFSLLVVAIMTTALPAWLKAWSLASLSATKQTLLGSVDPLITGVMAWALLKEKPKIHSILAVAIGMFGVAAIVLWDVEPNSSVVWYTLDMPECALLASIIIGRYGWMHVQKWLHNNRYAPTQINMLIQAIAGCFSAIIWMLSTGVGVMQGQELVLSRRAISCITVNEAILLVIAAGVTIVLGNVVGYTLYTKSLQQHSAVLMSLMGMLIPLFVYAFSAVLYGDVLTRGMQIGAVCIVIAIGLYNIPTSLRVYKKRIE